MTDESEIARRVLPDGRVVIVYRRVYNTLLTISSLRSLEAGTWDDGY